MTVAVDVDDTIIDTIGSLILFHNNIYGTNFKEEDFYSCWYREVWGGTKEEEIKKLEDFYKSNYYSEIIPIKGSQKTLISLIEEGIEFQAVTGRVYDLIEKTEGYIKKHFPNIFSNIYHTNSYGLTGIKIRKSEVCKNINADFIIDDDMNHVVDCTNAGIPVLVFNKPWNQGILPNGAFRMNSWEELPNLINQIKAQL